MNIRNIVVNSDLDAIVSSYLLSKNLSIPTKKILFVSPSDVQKEKIFLKNSESYVGANIPYIEGLGLWFDHHESNIMNHKNVPGSRDKYSPSCARIIYNYFNEDELINLLSETDRIDSGKITAEDLINPKSYSLLSCVINDDITNTLDMDFNRNLVSRIGKLDITDLLKEYDVNFKIKRYQKNLGRSISYLSSRYEIIKNLMIVDMRDAYDSIFLEPSFKFLHYAFNIESNISIRIYHPGMDKSKTRFQVGASILNRTSKIDLGMMLKEYGGGGHYSAAGVTLDSDTASKLLPTIIEKLIAD